MKRLMLLVLFLLPTILMKAQTGGVCIGNESQIAHVKAILDIVSENKGLLIPRMTTSQRNNMLNGEDNTSKALLVFDVNLNSFMYWTGQEWESLAKGSKTLIVDNLTSDSQYMSLSARQGKILRETLEAEFVKVNEELGNTSDSLYVQRADINKNNKDISLLDNRVFVNEDSLVAHRVDINNNRLKSDEQIGINASAIQANADDISIAKNELQAEIDETQLGSGLQPRGAYLANSSSHFLKTAVSLMDADEKLDIQLKTNADEIINNAILISANNNDIVGNTSRITENALEITANKTSILSSNARITTNSAGILANEISIASISESLGNNITGLQKELDDTQVGTGLEAGGEYVPNTITQYIKDAISLKNADEKLDVQLKVNADDIVSANSAIAKNLSDIATKADKVNYPEAGDLQFFNGTEWVRLPKGDEGQVLVVDKNTPTWSDKIKDLTLIAYKIAVANGSVTVQDLRDKGFSVKDLIEVGITTTELLQGGVSIGELIDAGVTVPELVDAGVTIPELVDAGVDVVGLNYGGGLIAYVNTGTSPDIYGFERGHGLIAMSSDVSPLTGIQWCAGSSVSTGANSETDGKTNTEKIIAVLGTSTSYAARLCAECTEGGYVDWYLPSKGELNLLYLNKAKLGRFSGNYWSSTDSDKYNAWGQYFSSGLQYAYLKGRTCYVRCVRKF